MIFAEMAKCPFKTSLNTRRDTFTNEVFHLGVHLTRLRNHLLPSLLWPNQKDGQKQEPGETRNVPPEVEGQVRG
jgi:hypothetical protein